MTCPHKRKRVVTSYECPFCEVERLRKELNGFRDALIWCSGADDFQVGGKAHLGWERGPAKLLRRKGA